MRAAEDRMPSTNDSLSVCEQRNAAMARTVLGGKERSKTAQASREVLWVTHSVAASREGEASVISTTAQYNQVPTQSLDS